MSRFWETSGQLLVDPQGRAILCEECPCAVPTVAIPCCSGVEVPQTLYGSCSLNGVTFSDIPMTYTLDAPPPNARHMWSGTILCTGGRLKLAITCNVFDGEIFWGAGIALDFLGDGPAYFPWANEGGPAFFVDIDTTCSPFSLHAEDSTLNGSYSSPSSVCGVAAYPSGGGLMTIDVVP